MPYDQVVGVPIQDPALSLRVVALHKGKEPANFYYLQGMRSGLLKRANPNRDPEQSPAAKLYHIHETRYFAQLANAVSGQFEAILSPPSNMAWQAEPYRRAIVAKYPQIIDLTDSVLRKGNARAGSDAPLEEIFAQLSYVRCGLEETINSLLIVDDTFSTGTTGAAIVMLLRKHGLSPACEVTLACPLWLER